MNPLEILVKRDVAMLAKQFTLLSNVVMPLSFIPR